MAKVREAWPRAVKVSFLIEFVEFMLSERTEMLFHFSRQSIRRNSIFKYGLCRDVNGYFAY